MHHSYQLVVRLSPRRSDPEYKRAQTPQLEFYANNYQDAPQERLCSYGPVIKEVQLRARQDGSVWESNPLTAFFKPPTGFEDQGAPSATTDDNQTSDLTHQDLASCLALLARKSADLALIVEHWDALPKAVQAGITAMVRAASAR